MISELTNCFADELGGALAFIRDAFWSLDREA
jgi:hypothetical protein